MKIIHLIIVTILSATATYANNAETAGKKMGVIDPVVNVDALLPADADQEAHIVFVNVNNAMPEDDFRKAAAYIRMKYQLRVSVKSASGMFAQNVMADTAFLKETFGDKAVLVIAVVKEEKAPSYLSIPGWFAQVNVSGLYKDGPDELFTYKRNSQMLMKGLAYACGLGATMDNMCAMEHSSFTLEGMDAVSATYGPNTFFPMQTLFRKMTEGKVYVY